MDKGEKMNSRAQENFEMNYNCAESVLKAYLEEYGKNNEMLSAATCFGGGFAGKKKICGVISGSFIALGLHFGRKDSEEKEVHIKARQAALELMEALQEQKGSIKCEDYVTYDLTTQEGREKLHSDKEMRESCKELMLTATGLLASALEKR